MKITKPKLVVGLGNPGEQYQFTRHNVGFMAIDSVIKLLAKSEVQAQHLAESWTWTLRYAGQNLLLQKPLTYMNCSGAAVLKICRKFNFAPQDVLIIYDDVSLPLGQIRLRKKGSSGGQNGVQDIIDKLGTQQIARIRIGVGPENGQSFEENLADYVLANFYKDEELLLDEVLKQSCLAVRQILKSGFEQAMNCYNGKKISVIKSDDEIKETEN